MIGMQNGCVARFTDGRVAKGFTEDLVPGRPAFHLRLADGTFDSRKARIVERYFGGMSRKRHGRSEYRR